MKTPWIALCRPPAQPSLSWLRNALAGALASLLFLPGAWAAERTPMAGTAVYVIPFQSIMVPAAVEELVFDRIVDRLNEQGAPLGLRFVIVKDAEGDPRLQEQPRISGELFGYLEEAGCCYTEIRLRSRVRLHRPGGETPQVIDYPREAFFQNDFSTIKAERLKLAEETAATLAARLLKALSPS